MRNLAEYPVTLDEVIACLEQLKLEFSTKGLIGDMRPLLLDHAIAAVQYRQMKLWEREQPLLKSGEYRYDAETKEK